MATTNLAKNKSGYGYKYTELAQIHEYLEANGMSYYQYIMTEDGADYIYTVPIINNEEKPARRGCRIIQVAPGGKANEAQAQGSGITYARRYSLLMAFGLATEDDDGESLTQQRPQQRQPQPQQSDENEFISGKDVEALKKVLESKQINVEFLLNLYKLPAMEKTTKKAYANIMKNIDKIKEKQEEKK